MDAEQFIRHLEDAMPSRESWEDFGLEDAEIEEIQSTFFMGNAWGLHSRYKSKYSRDKNDDCPVHPIANSIQCGGFFSSSSNCYQIGQNRSNPSPQ